MAKYQHWIAKNPNVSSTLPLSEQLFVQRGLQDTEARESFFSDDITRVEHPQHLTGCTTAVNRIAHAVERREHIAIYGDYDVDGITSACILKQVLDALGHRHTTVFLPHRERHGYGLNAHALDELHKQGVSLVITVDCGINAVSEAQHAQHIGLDLIITDHHHVPTTLPHAVAHINPKLPTCKSSYKDLAGAAVAWKLGWALLEAFEQKAGTRKTSHLPKLAHQQLDLVALATIADITPLTGENRILTKQGLALLRKAQRPGIKALLDVAGSKAKTLNEWTVGFQIAPRLNASGRLENAQISYDLLTTTSYNTALPIARQLNAINQHRKDITNQCTAQAQEQLNDHTTLPKTILIKDAQWPSGILGLIAAKISQHYGRPTLALGQSQGYWKGSARSFGYFDITQALTSTAEHLHRYGGHATAAGFSLEIDKLPDFSQALLDIAEQTIADEHLIPTLTYDAMLSEQELHWDTLTLLDTFAPFGFHNEQPLLYSDHLELFDLRTIGSQQNHVKCKFLSGNTVIDGIAFDYVPFLPSSLPIGTPMEAVYHLEVNEWQGVKNLQMRITDMRPR